MSESESKESKVLSRTTKQGSSSTAKASWIDRSIWTDCMLAALETALKERRQWPNKYFAEAGLFTMKEAWQKASQSRC